MSMDINDYIRKNASRMTDAQMARELTKKEVRGARGQQLTENAISKRRRSMGLAVYIEPQPLSVLDEVKVEATRDQNAALRQKNKELARHVDELQKTLDVALNLKNTKIKTSEIKKKHSDGTSESVAVVLISDLHVDERVLKHEVNGLNEYNPDIARERVHTVFENALKLVKMAQLDSHIDTVVFGFLGDMISGSIHDELAETNSLEPAFAVRLAYQVLREGIDYVANDESIKNIIIRCHSGNHGRMTDKNRNGQNEAGNSLEYILYQFLADTYEGTKVKVEVPEASMSYMNILSTELRFMHGHTIKYQGGVGGPTVPINRNIPRWDRGHRADITLMGHLHTFLDGGNFMVNGSVIGTTAYSMKFGHEQPRQTFFMVTHALGKPRGKTLVAPIWAD